MAAVVSPLAVTSFPDGTCRLDPVPSRPARPPRSHRAAAAPAATEPPLSTGGVGSSPWRSGSGSWWWRARRVRRSAGPPLPPSSAARSRRSSPSSSNRATRLWSIAGALAPDADPREVVDALVEARGTAALLPGETITWLDD